MMDAKKIFDKNEELIRKAVQEEKEKVYGKKKVFELPHEIYRELSQMAYLRGTGADDFIYSAAFQELRRYFRTHRNITKKDMNAVLHWLDKCIDNDYSWIDETERELKPKAMIFMVNLVCNVEEVNNGYHVDVLESEDDICEKFLKLYENDDFKPLFTYGKMKEEERRRNLAKNPVPEWEDGMTYDDMVDALSEHAKKVNESLPKVDKRYKSNVDILMIDVETNEIVKIYPNRASLIAELGINSHVLTDCVRTTKDPNKSKWRKWKQKDTGKRYYFKERAKEKSDFEMS